MSRWTDRMSKKAAPVQKAGEGPKKRGRPRKLDAPKAASPASPPEVAELLSKPKEGRPSGGRPFALSLDMQISIGTQVNSLADLLHRYGKLFCTQEEMAGLLGVSHQTLITFFGREPLARKIFEDGRAHGKASLRRSQAKLADKNATMAIFMGMNYLDQKDLRGVEVKGNIGVEVSILGAMLKEIDEEARAGRRGTGDDAKVIEHQPHEKDDGKVSGS